MDLFEVSIFSLSPKEKEECAKMNIPNYYWYYCQSQKFGSGAKALREFVKSRVKTVFSKQELEILTRSIVRKIRELVTCYHDGESQGIESLEKEFNSKVFSLVKNILDKRDFEKKKKKKGNIKKIKAKKVKRIFKMISSDGQALSPRFILDRGKVVKDKDCMYFVSCGNLSPGNEYRLDCSSCEHNTI